MEGEADEVLLCPDVGRDVSEAVVRSITEVKGNIMEVRQGGRGHSWGVSQCFWRQGRRMLNFDPSRTY